MESYQSNVTGQILLNIKTVKSKETNLLMPKPNYSTLSQQAPQENIHTSKKNQINFPYSTLLSARTIVLPSLRNPF